MSDAYRDMIRAVRDEVEDELQCMDDSDLGMTFRDGYDVHEVADSAVPVYYAGIFEALVEGGLCSAEPEMDGATNPAQMAQHVLFDECAREAYEAFEDFKANEEDQANRFMRFLDANRGEDWDAEDAYYAWTDDPRRSVPEWGDDSDWYEDIFKEWKEGH